MQQTSSKVRTLLRWARLVLTHVIVTLANMHRVSQAETALKMVLVFRNDMCFGKCPYVCRQAATHLVRGTEWGRGGGLWGREKGHRRNRAALDVVLNLFLV